MAENCCLDLIVHPFLWKRNFLQTSELVLNYSLQSTVKVEQCVSELRSLMIALPLQGEHFCTLALNVLHNYRETCQAAYRGIVQPDSEDKKICSAAWLKDDDISRFIKYVYQILFVINTELIVYDFLFMKY